VEHPEGVLTPRKTSLAILQTPPNFHQLNTDGVRPMISSRAGWGWDTRRLIAPAAKPPEGPRTARTATSKAIQGKWWRKRRNGNKITYNVSRAQEAKGVVAPSRKYEMEPMTPTPRRRPRQDRSTSKNREAPRGTARGDLERLTMLKGEN